MYQFEGKVAIVSGAASGIGRAVAIRLAQEGASVAVFDLPDRTTGEAASGLKETAAEIEKTGAKAYIQLTDVSSAENVEKSFSAVMEHFGRLDIIVNVAGIGGGGSANFPLKGPRLFFLFFLPAGFAFFLPVGPLFGGGG